MAFFDKLKAKASELGLDEKAALAKEKAAAAADANRGKIAGAVDKAASAVNDKTDGKYADKVAKAQGAAMTGVDKVAAQGGTTAGTTPGGPLDSGEFGTSAVATDRALDADLAAGTTPPASTSSPTSTTYSADLAGDADLSGDVDFSSNSAPASAGQRDSDAFAHENATQRTVGQDGVGTADDQFAGESPVERAIGADAPTSSLDPATSFQAERLDEAGSEGDFGGTGIANQNGDGEVPMRRVGDTPQH